MLKLKLELELELSKLSNLHLFLYRTMTMVDKRIDDASNSEYTSNDSTYVCQEVKKRCIFFSKINLSENNQTK